MEDIGTLAAKRLEAWQRGDLSLVAELTDYLARLGYVSTAIPEEPQERAVPVKRGPGRPRKNPAPGV